ncbi:hypothetical protein [Mongoliitalea lutea]|uniref:Uncharacterized protein n=1 Tax=Mongoliitalea lutea TaxID=849756 RepID=A0A8J3G5T6_9BACT|nr:hypothetical protein [Mongoliitalea lutea]GHB40105.1 hypothetical protein GCM10008106_21610 [Mongoliitalea lutea]
MKSKKKKPLKNEEQKTSIEEENTFDFGGLPSDIPLTKNIGCASNARPKKQEKKWKEAE